ncbi:Hsp70 family protein [Roseibium aggregatum]|uniref:Hsp70 family protein n=1 Tax=Roseibium aggregatum TaxID=187304 RepID=UPI001E55D6CA|nr:Hsp70 family protein [Roseibium aggregatum]UES52876.1 Hsp70 family protein [Roseibium aggregatum]
MYLGIDLGTSNSAVVGYLDGQGRLFKAADGADVLPSVIYLDRRGHRFVGKAAQDRLLTAPKNVASGFKRLMGTKTPIKFAGESWTPEQCSAEIIKTLVGQAITETGVQEVSGAVITIPAAFNQMQNEATISAAKMAGLKRVSLLQEPVAAAMASIAHSKKRDGVFLVYDLGGGTFDVALVLSTQGAVNVIAHEGINMLGGRDFDRMIFDELVRPWIIDQFDIPEHFQKEAEYAHIAKVARFSIERAKIQLSAANTASIFASEDELRATDRQGEEMYISLDISRDEIERLIRDRLNETIDLCRKIIRENGYSNEDISRIVPIGGPSKMPIVRQLLRDELAIEVEQGLDPMTAVATGAAIFAESRNWTDEGSTRKESRVSEKVTGSVNLSLDFKSRVSDETTRLRLKPASEIIPGFEVEVLDEDGRTSGKKPIDGLVNLTLRLSKEGENRFKIRVTDPSGNEVGDVSRQITIVRTAASAAGIPQTYTLAVKTQAGVVGAERNVLSPLLRKGASLPAEGEEAFRAAKTLKGGDRDFISFQFYQMAEGIEDPERNLYIGDFQLDAATELDLGERLNRGDSIIVRWKMSDNGLLNFSVELPTLGKIIDAHNLYLAPAGHKNFEGQAGSEIASQLLAQAEKDLEEIDEVLGETADPSGSLRNRIESQHLALSTSTEADTNRSVAEEARRLQQQIALLRMAPENQKRVLDAEIAVAEEDFDLLRPLASEVELGRYERLVTNARRLVREQDYEAARHSVQEMRGMRMKLMVQSPDYLVGLFRNLAESTDNVIDPLLHEQHTAEGFEAIQGNDIEQLKVVIGQIFKNQVFGGGDAAEIVELAHILGR